MTKKGIIPLTLPAVGTKIVGQLIKSRASRPSLLSTPLRELPLAGEKLLAAVRRSKGKKRILRLWSMTRSQAFCIFSYLCLYFHPSNADKKR